LTLKRSSKVFMLRRHYAITNSAVMSKTDRIARRRPPSDRLLRFGFIYYPSRSIYRLT